MQGTVTKFGTTKNGKSTIYIDQKMYFVGRCDVAGLQVGDRIDFEGHAFSDDGKLWGLDKWGKLPKENGGTTLHPYVAPTTASGSLDEPLRQTFSNIAGSMARAGAFNSLEPLDLMEKLEILAGSVRAAHRKLAE